LEHEDFKHEYRVVRFTARVGLFELAKGFLEYGTKGFPLDIMLSLTDDDGKHAEAKNAGATECLVKPSTRELFQKVIEKFAG